MSKKLYDILKVVGRIVLPLGTFISALCQIWGIPYGEQITASLAAVAALINAVLGLSSVGYWREHEITEKERPDDPAEN